VLETARDGNVSIHPASDRLSWISMTWRHKDQPSAEFAKIVKIGSPHKGGDGCGCKTHRRAAATLMFLTPAAMPSDRADGGCGKAAKTLQISASAGLSAEFSDNWHSPGKATCAGGPCSATVAFRIFPAVLRRDFHV
jgi:hypothetical protein